MDNEKNEIKEKPSKAKTSALAGVYDIIEVIAISMIIVMLLFTFVARLSTVDGDSMFDTFKNGDRVIISKLFYTPKTGDILVFQQPGGFFDEPLIKRVIATEGQTVYIDFDKWLVYVDGQLLVERYVTFEAGKSMRADNYYHMYEDYFDENGVIVIPEGKMFVMGDNRNHSSDSRFSGVGLVDTDDIMGKVIFRVFPKLGKAE